MPTQSIGVVSLLGFTECSSLSEFMPSLSLVSWLLSCYCVECSIISFCSSSWTSCTSHFFFFLFNIRFLITYPKKKNNVYFAVDLEMMHISLFGLTDWLSSWVWKVTLFVHSSKGWTVGWLFILEVYKGPDQEELSFICGQFHPQTFPKTKA